MSDLPYPWDRYLAVQNKLLASTRVDEVTWGYEHALAAVVADPWTDCFREPGAVERAARSESRKVRRRFALLKLYASVAGRQEQPSEDAGAMARSDLASIGRELRGRDCELLCAIGAGSEYGEIANDFDVSPGALRVRVVRLRSRLLRVVAV